MTMNLKSTRLTNWGGMQIDNFSQPNDLTANRACIDQLKCPIISDAPATGGGGGTVLPDGTNYSDYLFWDPTTSSWQVGQDSVHLGTDAGLSDQAAPGQNVNIGYQSMAGPGPPPPSIRSRNITIGYQAGINGALEEDAVLIGNRAGAVKTSGGSVGIGYQALVNGNNSSASRSIAIGFDAGSRQAPGAIAIGTNAGQSNGVFPAPLVHGENCIAIGFGASYNDDGGSAVVSRPNQLIIGTEAGYNGIGEGSVAIGYQAAEGGVGDGEGKDTVMIGTHAGYRSDVAGLIGSGTVAIGYQALGKGNFANALNPNGDPSIAIGSQAGYGQGSYAIAIGIGAARLPAIGANPVGYQGNQNIAIGYHASYQEQIATAPFPVIEEITIGTQAGQDGMGLRSIAIGYQAGIKLGDEAAHNVIIGTQAGGSAKPAGPGLGVGAASVAIGFQALIQGRSDGNNQVAIGTNAGTAQDDFAIAIGTKAAGLSDATTSSSQGLQSIAIGLRAGEGSNTVALANMGGGSIAIGDRAGQTYNGRVSIAIGTLANANGSNGFGVPFGFSTVLNSSGIARNATGNNQLHIATRDPTQVPAGCLQIPNLVTAGTSPGNIPDQTVPQADRFTHYLVYDSATGEIQACPVV